MTRKKQHGIKTTSRKTGAIILILLVALIAFTLAITFYGLAELEKQYEKEEAWHKQPCEIMLEDYSNDRQPWKQTALFNKECI